VRKTQDIFFNQTGQSLILDCPDGQPSAVVSVRVFLASADDITAPEFTPTGTVDATPNTTVSGASGFSQLDPTAINVTATSGAQIGRRYTIASLQGHQEWFEVVDIGSGTLYSKYPLINDYEAGSTVKTTRVTAPVDATWVADTSNVSPMVDANPYYRVRWELTVGGAARIYTTDIDLIRYEGRHHVLPLDVDQRFPGWLDRVPIDSRRRQGVDLIDEAYRLLVRDLHADRMADQGLRNGEAVDALVVERVGVLLGDERSVFRQMYDQHIRSGTPIQTDETGGGGAARVENRLPIFTR